MYLSTVAKLMAIALTLLTAPKLSLGQGQAVNIGNTTTKALYVSGNAVTYDFVRGDFFCKNILPRGRAAGIETDEEFSLVDEYLKAEAGGGATSSDALYTSGFGGLGTIPTQWTSTGSPIPTISITKPWQPGSDASPSYLWYKFISIQYTCFSWSAGSPCSWEGGHGFRTQLIWSTGDSRKRILCEIPL